MKLQQYLDSVREKPFNWATWNCCHFSAGWVRAVEGKDPIAGLDLPATQIGILRLGKSGGLPERVTAALGRDPMSNYFAYVGDLVYVPRKDGVGIIAICNGVTAVTLLIGGGYWTVPMDEATLAWKIKQ